MREPLLTVDQIADELQVNPETVRRWLKARELIGVLPSIQTGWRVDRADLNAFLAERTARLQPA